MAETTVRKFSPRKQLLFTRTKDLFTQYSTFTIINLNNITSNQLQQAKREWYGKAVFLFGKNTTITKALREIGRNDIIEKIKGNIAFIFTNENIRDIKDILLNNSRDTNAKVDAIAQRDVFIEKQVTSMGPDKTSFFQAMGISTKITKGKVEIIQPSHVLKVGQKVTPSQANLLNIMGILPFTYSMKIENVYDKEFYSPWIIDITDEDITDLLQDTVSRITALCLSTGTITKPSSHFLLRNAGRDVAALSLALGLTNELTSKMNIDD